MITHDQIESTKGHLREGVQILDDLAKEVRGLPDESRFVYMKRNLEFVILTLSQLEMVEGR